MQISAKIWDYKKKNIFKKVQRNKNLNPFENSNFGMNIGKKIK